MAKNYQLQVDNHKTPIIHVLALFFLITSYNKSQQQQYISCKQQSASYFKT